jgi:hypothetical protein
MTHQRKDGTMTWSANLRVQDVSDGPRPIDVLLVADASATVKPYEGREDVPPETRDFEQPEIISNTEGKIKSLELKIVLDEDSTTLKPGDRVSVNGHFDARAS